MKESIAKVKISTEWSEGEVSTGWGGKINPTLVRVGEIAIGFLTFQLPGLLAVLIGRNIPVLKNLLPTGFVKAMVLSSIRTSFVKSLESVRKDVFLQFVSAESSFFSFTRPSAKSDAMLSVACFFHLEI